MTFQQSGNTMEQNKTFKIVIEDYYLEEIIRRNDNLERYKNHLLSFPVNHPMSKNELIMLIKHLESLSFSVKELKNRINEINEKDIENILNQA